MDQQVVGDFPPGLARWADLLDVLGQAGSEAARQAARATFRAVDRRRGGKRLPRHAAHAALAAGSAATAEGTPMWHALALALDEALKQPGARARLARYLGVPRQRVTDFTKGRRSPDAELTLRLLQWLVALRTGLDPSLVLDAPAPKGAPAAPAPKIPPAQPA
jgi:hypothetical protein